MNIFEAKKIDYARAPVDLLRYRDIRDTHVHGVLPVVPSTSTSRRKAGRYWGKHVGTKYRYMYI